jgi:hypothetical protein
MGAMAQDGPILYGANGVEVGDLVVVQGKDKIVFLAKFSGDHYTLQFGTHSGIIDFHKTWRDDHGATRHETLFAIRHEQLLEFLAAFIATPAELLKLVRHLRVGWLARNGITIVHGLHPTTDEQIAAVTTRRKKRLVADEEKFLAGIIVPEYLEDVYDFPDGAFSLFAGNTEIGIGFKRTDATGRNRLRWIKLRDLRQLFTANALRLLQAVHEHAIPTADYRQ